MLHSAIEIHRIGKSLESALTDFFNAIKQIGDDRYFHPHSFDSVEANKIAHYTGQDLYYAVIEDDQIVGYGMLRGWDMGFKIPSLGIAIHPKMRGMQLGKLLMYFLHTAAQRRGAIEVRLKVYPDNKPAIHLYQELGYMFQGMESGQLLGTIKLK